MKYLKLVLLLMITGFTYAQPPAFSVQKCGNGKPLLMLAGFATPGAVWQETVNALPSSYKFHLITYAGFGGQSAIEMPWYDKIRDELIAYIRQENLTGISLLGHSMGGNLAVEIAAIIPERVDKLILLDALPCMRELMMPGVQAKHITYDNPHNQQMLAMDEATFRQTANMMASRMTSDSLRVTQLTEWMVSADRTTFVHGYTDLLRLDLRDQLENIQSPTLVLGASFPDKDVALSHFNNQYANLDNKKIEMAPNSRHYIMWDAPDWMYQQIVDFLQ